MGRLSRKEHYNFRWSSRGSIHCEVEFNSLKKQGRSVLDRKTMQRPSEHAQHDFKMAREPKWPEYSNKRAKDGAS